MARKTGLGAVQPCGRTGEDRPALPRREVGVPRGATATTHILKPAIDGFDGHDLHDYLCMAAAGRVGIPVARTRVQRFGAESAIMIERYDRREAEGLPIRVHQEDLCQALGVHPGRNYQADGGPTPGDIVGLMRRAMPASAANGGVRRSADALVWNGIIAETDAHAKNYSLLLSGQQVRLAPLYDIASALPYPDFHEKKLKFAMKIGGDDKVFTSRSTWPKAAAELGVDPEALVARAAELAERAPGAFAAARGLPGWVARCRVGITGTGRGSEAALSTSGARHRLLTT